jgi:hypothetical protein
MPTKFETVDGVEKLPKQTAINKHNITTNLRTPRIKFLHVQFINIQLLCKFPTLWNFKCIAVLTKKPALDRILRYFNQVHIFLFSFMRSEIIRFIYR